MIERFKGVFFDFDFTLGDSSEGICESVNYALRRMSLPEAERELICKQIGLPLFLMYENIAGRSDQHEKEQFRALFSEKANEVVVASSSLYPSVVDLLKSLSEQGKHTAIISTKRRSHLVGIAEKHSIGQYVSLIVGGDEVKVHKPDPEGILKAAVILSLKPSEIVYIGDSIVDAEAAARAEVDFIAVLSGTTKRDQLLEYTSVAIIDRIAEMLG